MATRRDALSLVPAGLLMAGGVARTTASINGVASASELPVGIGTQWEFVLMLNPGLQEKYRSDLNCHFQGTMASPAIKTKPTVGIFEKPECR